MTPERVLRDLIVERRSIDRLIPYIRNARTHTEEQIAQVAASIVEFGWTNPILIGADGVIIGSRLVRAAGDADDPPAATAELVRAFAAALA